LNAAEDPQSTSTMAENVHSAASMPIPIRPTGMKITPPSDQSHIEQIATNHTNLGVLSPVNQNGSFEFDRVIKSGTVNKRTRKTKVRATSSCPFGLY
jgi:hypothetical protein